jgi:cyclopropane fatty-acyl-phospholipid synthase-like methyltransferase
MKTVETWIDYFNCKAKTLADRLAVSEMHCGNEEATQAMLAYEKQRLVQLLQPDKDGVLLDLGCGTGVVLEMMEPLFKSVVGVDLASGPLAMARKHLPRAELIQDDISSLKKLGSRKFHYVMSFGSLQFLSPDQLRNMLRTLDRVTLPGARIVLCRIPNRERHDEYQIHRAHRRGRSRNAPIECDLAWTWFDPEEFVTGASDYARVIPIFPNYGTGFPLLGFMDVVLIKS